MRASRFHPHTPLPTVLIFAASDPVSGAGVQADLLTLAAMGCHPATAITALTVQDTVGVASVTPVAAKLVDQQARAVLADMPVAAFKVGVLGSRENAAVVATIAADHPEIPLVLDPVLASGRGDAFADEALIAALIECLCVRATLMTPNTLEARRLAAIDDLEQSVMRLLAYGARYVLLTGAHEVLADGKVHNRLYAASGLLSEESWPRLPGEFHGSGCTLASACAAGLAHGKDMPTAAREAQAFTWQSLARAFRPGKGQHIPHRLFGHDDHDGDD